MVEINDELKREVGQHFVVGFHGHEVSDNIKTLIRDYHVGNIILMKRNVRSVSQVHKIVQELQQIAKDSGHSQPLMIGTDQENGLVAAFTTTTSNEAGTQFPGAMAIAATGSVDMAEQVATASAHEMKLAGINWVYSPVADVNSDPRNPVIGVRSFGDDPQEVGRYATAVSRGLSAVNVAPSAKHFPGHGDTHVDSHLALPVIRKSMSDLLTTEIPPFQSLINSGCASIMTGHMALPTVTGDNTPCSLSKKITTDLLRTQLGFNGLVVTDCLEMEAVVEGYGSRRPAVLSFIAGADIAMICHTFDRQVGAVMETYDALESGEFNPEELKVSGQRIKKLKERFAGTWEDVFGDKLDEEKLAILKNQNLQLSKTAYAASVTIIQGPLPPMPIDGPVLLLTPETQSINPAVDDLDSHVWTAESQVRNTAGPSYLAFAELVKRRVDCNHIVYSFRHQLSQSDIQDASAIIFVTRNADGCEWQVGHLQFVRQQAGNIPLVLLQSCGPYDLLNVDQGQAPVPSLGCFEYTASALGAAVCVIFGEAEARGTVPVLGGKVVG